MWYLDFHTSLKLQQVLFALLVHLYVLTMPSIQAIWAILDIHSWSCIHFGIFIFTSTLDIMAFRVRASILYRFWTSLPSYSSSYLGPLTYFLSYLHMYLHQDINSHCQQHMVQPYLTPPNPWFLPRSIDRSLVLAPLANLKSTWVGT